MPKVVITLEWILLTESKTVLHETCQSRRLIIILEFWCYGAYKSLWKTRLHLTSDRKSTFTLECDTTLRNRNLFILRSSSGPRQLWYFIRRTSFEALWCGGLRCMQNRGSPASPVICRVEAGGAVNYIRLVAELVCY